MVVVRVTGEVQPVVEAVVADRRRKALVQEVEDVVDVVRGKFGLRARQSKPSAGAMGKEIA